MTRNHRLLTCAATMVVPATLIATHWEDTSAIFGRVWLALLQAGLVVIAGVLISFAAVTLTARVSEYRKRGSHG